MNLGALKAQREAAQIGPEYALRQRAMANAISAVDAESITNLGAP